MPVKKILIVDDSSTDRQALVERLSKHGYRCITADNGDEGIAKSKSEQPDLILMDVVMPGINGYEATRAISRDPSTRDIPVIICTGRNQETDRVWGMRQGARDYVTKPIDYKALVERIAAIA
ncbi:MAG TPA: response regulator [Burkholderiales bacterium]|nr:response regulator [Burkholderiales bacterium]